jgi:hypothetical protein
MLSDEDKARIKAEEEYRAQLRADLEADKALKRAAQSPNLEASKAALRDPPKSQPAASSTSTGCLGFFILSIVVIVVVVFLVNLGGGNQSSEQDGYDEYDFTSQCQDLMRDQLKAPSTASFPNSYELANEVRKTAKGDFAWSSFVDAENSFGAKIRSAFVCTFTKATNKVNVVPIK